MPTKNILLKYKGRTKKGAIVNDISLFFQLGYEHHSDSITFYPGNKTGILKVTVMETDEGNKLFARVVFIGSKSKQLHTDSCSIPLIDKPDIPNTIYVDPISRKIEIIDTSNEFGDIFIGGIFLQEHLILTENWKWSYFQ